MSTHNVIMAVIDGVSKLDEDRQEEDLPTEFPSHREALVCLHEKWQTFMMACKDNKSHKIITEHVIMLSAAGVKFCTDLGIRETR